MQEPRGADLRTCLGFADGGLQQRKKVRPPGLFRRSVDSIRPENIDAWLNPDPKNLAAQYAILDDRARPYDEHRLAA